MTKLSVRRACVCKYFAYLTSRSVQIIFNGIFYRHCVSPPCVHSLGRLWCVSCAGIGGEHKASRRGTARIFKWYLNDHGHLSTPPPVLSIYIYFSRSLPVFQMTCWRSAGCRLPLAIRFRNVYHRLECTDSVDISRTSAVCIIRFGCFTQRASHRH